jgi:hypothetical protein
LRLDDFRPPLLLLRLELLLDFLPELLLELLPELLLELLRPLLFLRPPLFAAAMLSLHDEVRTLTDS